MLKSRGNVEAIINGRIDFLSVYEMIQARAIRIESRQVPRNIDLHFSTRLKEFLHQFQRLRKELNILSSQNYVKWYLTFLLLAKSLKLRFSLENSSF